MLKREDLKSMGLESDKIDKIMSAYGQDKEKIENYDSISNKLESLTSSNKALQKQIDDNKDALNEASKVKGLTDEQQTKINGLKDQLKQSKADADKQLKQFKVDSAVELGLTKAGAKNTKAVKALLETDKIDFDKNGNVLGLDDQIKNLKADTNSAFLFSQDPNGNNKPTAIGSENPKVVQPQNSDKQEAAIQAALGINTPNK